MYCRSLAACGGKSVQGSHAADQVRAWTYVTKRSSLARDISDVVFDRSHMGSSATHLEVIAFCAFESDGRSSIFDLSDFRLQSSHVFQQRGELGEQEVRGEDDAGNTANL